MDQYCKDTIIDDTEVFDIKEKGKLANKQSAFIGQVKILGNIGDNKTIFGAIYDAEK